MFSAPRQTRKLDRPLDLRWSSDQIPLRAVKASCKPLLPVEHAPNYWSSGPVGLPFDFTHHIRLVCEDIVSRCSTFHHIKMEKLLFDFTTSRKNSSWGLQARVTPMRFENGALHRRKNRVTYRVQRYFVDGREILYLVTFCLPRFLNREFPDKLVTIFHELYHISPFFNGDLRRHPGHFQIHTKSQKEYDREMTELIKEYLHAGADQHRLAFLRLNYPQLIQRHQLIVGNCVPRPRLLPIR